MFTIRRRARVMTMVEPQPTPELLALLCRLRALSVEDEKLARLLNDLTPYLPARSANATVAAPE